LKLVRFSNGTLIMSATGCCASSARGVAPSYAATVEARSAPTRPKTAWHDGRIVFVI
jgi:hypothetical protein